MTNFVLLTALDYLTSSLSFFGILWLIVLFVVFRNIWRGSRSDVGKVIWSLIVFFFPIGGVILWWLFGKND